MGITWIFTVEVIFHFGVTGQASGRTPIWIYAYRTWQSSWVCLMLTDKLVSPRRDFKRLLGFSDDVRLWSRCSAVSESSLWKIVWILFILLSEFGRMPWLSSLLTFYLLWRMQRGGLLEGKAKSDFLFLLPKNVNGIRVI